MLMEERRWERAKSVFADAADRTGEARRLFVETACADDAELRRHVDSLLAAHDDAGDFLAEPTRVGEAAIAEISGGEAPGTRLGPYRLVRLLGEGGFGSVYVAEQVEPLRRTVALKVIKLGMDTRQVIARFEAERQALAMMDHPGIARVLDAGATDAGRPYFVMELVEGTPITTYCDERRFGVLRRLQLFAEVCLAVQHAHQKGIVHRDLKASNVLVTECDGRPVPKVIDFGIAKAVNREATAHETATEPGQLVGTPVAMSPEQLRPGDLDVDTRSDVYTLGVLLYELLAGAPPFDPDAFRGVGWAGIQQIITAEVPPPPSTRIARIAARTPSRADAIARARGADPAALRRRLAGELDWIVMKALEKDRTRRYATAAAFAEDLDRALADEPVVAGPPGRRYQAMKFLKRHWVAVTLAAVLAFVLFFVAGVALLGYTIARRERAMAEVARLEAMQQAELARSAQLEAESTRDEADAVTRFLSDMLASTDPAVPGRDVDVGALLDEASRSIDAQIADEPAVETRLRLTLGRTYLSLDRVEDAERELLRALRVARRELGLEHPATHEAIEAVIEMYEATGRPEEAARWTDPPAGPDDAGP
jgi:serine/threonine protein kinase